MTYSAVCNVETSLSKKYDWVIALDNSDLTELMYDTQEILYDYCKIHKKDISSVSVCLLLFENIEDSNINLNTLSEVLKKCPLLFNIPMFINDKHYYNLCKQCGLNAFRYYPSDDCRILMFIDRFDLNSNKIKYHFTNLSNSRHDHSYIIHKFLLEHNLLKDSIWSYANSDKKFEENYNKYLNFSESDYYKFNENFITGSNEVSSMTQRDLEPHISSAITINKETVYNSHGPHYSEKLIKCLAAGRPFIEVSSPYTLFDLKKHLGIKTFSDLIDEDYDLIADPHKRMLAIQKEIYRLSKKPLKDLVNYISENKNKFKYNYDLINEVWDRSTDIDDFTDPLILE